MSGSAYHQDHQPARELSEATGHAVRLTYLACAMADVAMEWPDPELAAAAERLWLSAYERKAYVTGGLGARYAGEAFGSDYELPNDRAYAETCAAVGGVMWNWRMLLRAPEARFADAIETTLYNGALAGIGLDGQSYFYANPLRARPSVDAAGADDRGAGDTSAAAQQAGGLHRRQPWYACACCPPNIARLLAQMPGYAFSVSSSTVWVHQFIAGEAHLRLPGDVAVALGITTEYPWDGDVVIRVLEAPSEPITLQIRIPGWCEGARLHVDGEAAIDPARASTYTPVRRTWRRGETVVVDLPMPPRRVMAHVSVAAAQGRVALARGPLVYCHEAADLPDVDPDGIRLPDDSAVRAEHRPDVLGGVTVLTATARHDAVVGTRLYEPLGATAATPASETRLTAIPYYAWANRMPGWMDVWIRRG